MEKSIIFNLGSPIYFVLFERYFAMSTIFKLLYINIINNIIYMPLEGSFDSPARSCICEGKKIEQYIGKQKRQSMLF